MTHSEINAANRASALEQLEQDERNDGQKADMMADRLVNGHAPRRPLYFRDDTKEDFLSEIVAENVRGSEERINYHE
ncbi:MAG TPA: hypothetical protein VGG72_21365 [Bryobacteraceae bacterium]|jgi:hypothetical protein